MMTNSDFLKVILKSFNTYLNVNTSRSTAKLKVLHGSIAKDLYELFGKSYTISSQGYGNDREERIDGRYYPKYVDIAVSKNGKAVAGYAVKFVMRNYSQNSNNYFENMLGETANIRSNNIPYFQIFIVFEKVPYYSSSGELLHYDTISEHNLEKYFILSRDNADIFYHTPDKTLLAVIKLQEPHYELDNSTEYAQYYKKIIDSKNLMSYSDKIKDSFGSSIVLNNYEDFLKRTYHIVMGKGKINGD